ncbi:hypothetical protein VTO73DRAFT_14678 [Trametes versicolor]
MCSSQTTLTISTLSGQHTATERLKVQSRGFNCIISAIVYDLATDIAISPFPRQSLLPFLHLPRIIATGSIMTENIPNEVLEAILHQAVIMSAKTFESWSTPAAFAGNTRSTAVNVLLVSRRWCELVIPALYEAAILRTKAQVRGLARSVHKTNERGIKRGAYLRRLRVEGGYHHHLHQILGDSPGIVSLFLGFDISLDDTSARFKRALQRINPICLFLQSTPGGHATQDNTQSLYAAVGGAMTSWTNLTQIVASPEFIFWNPMVLPLKDVPALGKVSMTTYTATHNIQSITLDYVIKNPSVKVIQIRDGVKWLNWKLNRSPYPREKFVLGEGNNMTPWIDLSIPHANQSPPNGALLALPDDIWSRVLGYATHVHGYNYLDMDGELVSLSEQEHVNVTRRHVVLVSKRFYRLGLPHLYSSPHLSTYKAASAFAAQVESSPELAKLVRVLCFRRDVSVPGILNISAPLVNLVHATDIRIHVLLGIHERIPAKETARLEDAVQSFPSTLCIAPSHFRNFPHLRKLTIQGGRGADLDDTHHDALPQLEYLNLVSADPELFQLFGSMGLPRLRELAFSTEHAEDVSAFLEIHGMNLNVLAPHGQSGGEFPPLLSLCPNITELHLCSVDLPENVPFVAESAPHAALKRVVCPSFIIGIPGKPQEEWKQWNAFVGFLKVFRHKLPALEEFRIFDMKWPMHESAYHVSRYTQLALDLHELDIAFADKDGTRWTRFDPLRLSLKPFR